MEKIKTQTIRNSGRISFALTRNHQVVKIAFVIIMISFVWMSVAAQYPYIRIADVLVSPENQDNVTSDYITGIVRYDSVSRTLILKNASINNYESGDPYDDSNGNTVIIEAHSGQIVNIELIGDNTIFGKIPLELHSGSYNITGAGSLTLNGTVAGVLCEIGVDTFHIGPGASVEIIVPYVLSTGFTGSPQHQDYSQTLLSIDSGTLIIEAGYCIRSVVDFQLNGSFIASPEGAYYDPGDKTLVTEEGPVHDYLEIRPGTVGISDYSVEVQNISVYPNPADDVLFIELRGGAGIANVGLYDLQGRAVGTRFIASATGASATVNMLDIPAGVYVLRVTDADGKEYHQKIVRK